MPRKANAKGVFNYFTFSTAAVRLPMFTFENKLDESSLTIKLLLDLHWVWVYHPFNGIVARTSEQWRFFVMLIKGSARKMKFNATSKQFFSSAFSLVKLFKTKLYQPFLFLLESDTQTCNQRSFIQLQGVEGGKQTKVTYDSITAIFVIFIGSIIYKFMILSFSMCVNVNTCSTCYM